MAFDKSLYQYDAGYYQLIEGKAWLAGKMVPNGVFTFSRKAVDAAVNVNLDESDVLIGTYPKTGKRNTISGNHNVKTMANPGFLFHRILVIWSTMKIKNLQLLEQ